MREYRTIRALRAGEVVNLDGLTLRMDVGEDGKEKEIKAGDLYVAERNTGPHLLTAYEVVKRGFGGWIHPTTIHYSFDLGECVKVIEA